jgi:CheY-like chemotaxis protein/anti-sigma regulatory factor (Ser/Thr protein kinase)
MNRVLIIEDDNVARQQLGDLFRFEDFEVVEAGSGEQGIARANESTPDLVICDIMMPGTDGFGVLQTLRRFPQTALTPFIFLTAKAAGQDVRQGMSEGADDYITKPFEAESLLASARQRLQRRKAQLDEAEKRANTTGMLAAAALPAEMDACLAHLERLSGVVAARADGTATPGELFHAMRQEIARLRKLSERLRLYAELPTMYAARFSTDEVAPSSPVDVALRAAQATTERWGRQHDLVISADSRTLPIPAPALAIVSEELVDNACKFSAPSTPILVNAGIDVACWKISVSDDGCGMSPAQIRSIGAFRQFWSEGQRPQGLGLGLVLVQTLTRLHSGEFQIEANAHGGTCATVMIPAE